MKILAWTYILIVSAAGVATAQAQGGGGTTLVLVPGAGGAVPSDFLIRNQRNFQAYGLGTVVATSAGQAASAANQIAAQGGRPVLVGMSAGTPKVAQAVAQGARAAGLVLVAGSLVPNPKGVSVIQAFGSPARLPPTLVVHHRQDECRLTPPEAVGSFVGWSGGRARVSWIDGGGGGDGRPCGPMSAHGFVGQDAQAVAAIASFARSQ